MAILLFRLNNVPDDEAEAVRALLGEHHIDYYETHAGRWGISVAAIWLRDDSRLTEAQTLIDDYQEQRTAEARAEYQRRRREGTQETLLQRAAHEPLRFLLMAALIAAVLYLTLWPFLGW